MSSQLRVTWLKACKRSDGSGGSVHPLKSGEGLSGDLEASEANASPELFEGSLTLASRSLTLAIEWRSLTLAQSF